MEDGASPGAFGKSILEDDVVCGFLNCPVRWSGIINRFSKINMILIQCRYRTGDMMCSKGRQDKSR